MVVPNWANGVMICPITPGANPLRPEWGLADKMVVGYSGNMGRAHEFRSIIDVAGELSNDTEIVFLFIGDGAQRRAIGDAAAERNLTNLLFKPYQPRESLDLSLGVADIHLVSLAAFRARRFHRPEQVLTGSPGRLADPRFSSAIRMARSGRLFVAKNAVCA